MNINRSDGYIKLHRLLNFSDLAEDPTAFSVFTRMLLMAHHEDDFTSIRYAGKQTYLKRGEFSASVSELAEFFNLPVISIRRAIEHLENAKRLSKRTDRQKTIFTICNYSKYQDVPSEVRANERANGRANDRANVPDAKRNKEIKNIYVESEKKLLSILSARTKRSFRVLPTGSKKLLATFSLEEIDKALSRMAEEPWHKQRLGELSSDYMLRASTIDKFLNNESAKSESFADRIKRMEGAGNAV